MYNKNKNIAFTLAEVLITLGIIGIVAAITIPIIGKNVQKIILKNQFKKSYANITNTINQVSAQNGSPFECYTLTSVGYSTYVTDECFQFWDELFKQLKIINTCAYRSSNCGVLYKQTTEVIEQGGEKTRGCSFLNSVPATVNILSDGSYLISTVLNTNNRNHLLYFTLDINGEKGPNKWGYDVFYMMLDRDKKTYNLTLSNKICGLKEKNGYYLEEMLSELAK